VARRSGRSRPGDARAPPPVARSRRGAEHRLDDGGGLLRGGDVERDQRLEAASACDCATLDVCRLFDSRAFDTLDPEARGAGGGARDGEPGARSAWAAAAPTSSMRTP
jgi:hypothetical protein